MRAFLCVSAALLLALPPPDLRGQTVSLPEKVEVKASRMGAVLLAWDGDDCRYTASAELDVFREYDPDPKKVRLRLIGYASGQYEIKAIACKGGKLSEFATCVVVVGDPTPPVPPGPAPGPGPSPVPPGPAPSPAPIPAAGFRCLIVYESAELGKMPDAQKNVLYAKSVRDYLNSKCVMGADGKTKEWRIWDKDTDASAESQIWQDALKRPRSQVPWIIVSDGKTGYEGPLPASVDETLALLKKYAEGK